MKALIIDDIEYKIQSLRSVLEKFECIKDIKIAKSFQTGVHAILEYQPDLVLLDMSLPTSERSGGEPEGRNRMYGGREILSEMKSEDIAAKVIIVTQFDNFGHAPNIISLDNLLNQLKRDYPRLFAGGIYYDFADVAWKAKLTTLIKKLIKL